ncbi:MAG: tetratricopeptide repeat protein [Fibrobacterota bacterium]
MVIMKRTLVAAFCILSILKAQENQSTAEIYAKSYSLEQQERYREAIKALAPIRKEYPKGYTVNYRTGWLSYLQGAYRDALRKYDAALTQYPNSMEVLHKKILVFAAQKRWEEAAETALRMIKTDYYNRDGNFWLARAYRKQGKLKQAREVASRMTYLYPTSIPFLKELALTLHEEGQEERARSLFGTILILDPSDTDAPNYLTNTPAKE